jgi:hypothetical protein
MQIVDDDLSDIPGSPEPTGNVFPEAPSSATPKRVVKKPSMTAVEKKQKTTESRSGTAKRA